MIKNSLLCLMAFVASIAHAGPAWVEHLTNGSIKFEMVNDENFDHFDLRTAGEIVEIPQAGGKTTAIQTFESPLAHELLKIQKKRGRVVLDCLLFVQIAAIYKQKRWAEGTPFIFPHENTDMELAPIMFDSDFANVGLASDEDFNMMQKTHFNNKSQWILPIDEEEDQYIGLSGSGVKVQGRQAWMNELRDGLFKELERAESCHSRLLDPRANAMDTMKASSTGLVSVLKKLGRLEKYTVRVFTSPMI